MKSLAYILNLRPRYTRTAVIIYGNSARSEIGFTDHTSPSSFFKRVDALPYLGGRRRMDRVLIEAGSVLNRARPSARKVVILLTAGRQTQGVGVPSLNRAMESIRSHSAKMFVIGIGQQVDQTELRPLTSDIFDISGFNTLRRHSIGIAKDIKNKTGTLTLTLLLG